MTQIVGLEDLRGAGAPSDIGIYQATCTVFVYQHTFSGVAYIVAAQHTDRGWVLIGHGTVASTVIQSAWNYIGVVGSGECFIARAQYNLAATLLIPNTGQMLVAGEGVNATIFYLNNGVNDDAIRTAAWSTNTPNVCLRDFAVNGNVANQAGGTALVRLAVYNSILQNLVIHHSYNRGLQVSDILVASVDSTNYFYNLVVYNTGHAVYPDAGGTEMGIYINNIDKQRFINCVVHDTWGAGVYVDSASPENFFYNTHVYNFGQDAFYFASRTQIVISCMAENGSYNGFNITEAGADTIPSETILVGCKAILCGSDSNIYDGFHIDGIAGHFVRWVTLVGCVSVNTLATQNQRYGFYVGTNTEGVEIIGGLAYCNREEGVWVNGGTHHLVSGVRCVDNSKRTAATYHGIYFNSAETTIVNCYVNSAHNYGIQSGTSGNYALIEGNLLYYTANQGVYVQGNATRILGNRIYHSGWHAIYVVNVTGCIIMGNDVYDPATSGIVSADSWENTITGNYIYSSASTGSIVLSGGGFNSVTSNTIDTSGSAGIFMTSSSNNVIENNMIHTSTTYGILIDATSNQNQCIGNHTDGSGTACVRVNNVNCARNVFTNNFFDEGDISNAGTNTRAWLNYDPSANVFITTINPPAVSLATGFLP